METGFQSFLHLLEIADLNISGIVRSSHSEVFFTETASGILLKKKMFIKISQNSQENTCIRASFSITFQVSACNFIKTETLVQVFSCEYCKKILKLFFVQNTSADCFCLENSCSVKLDKIYGKTYAMESYSAEACNST